MTAAFPTLVRDGLTEGQLLALSVSVIDSADFAVIVADTTEDAIVLAWCGVADVMFGWSQEEAIGRPLRDLVVPPGSVPAHNAALRRRHDTGTAHKVALWSDKLDAIDKAGRIFPIEISIRYAPDSDPPSYVARIKDITEQRAAAARAAADARRIHLQAGELYHQIGNRDANAIAIVRMSATKEDAIARLDARGRAHKLIRAAGDSPVDLLELAHVQAEPYAPGLSVSGPSLMLSGGAAQTLGMCIGEMATNAVKHGALSGRRGQLEPPKRRWWQWRRPAPVATAPSGRVEFTWHVEADTLVMDWRETGGPAPPPWDKRGKGRGSALIKDGLERDLGGTMSRDWPDAGLAAQVRIPLANIA